MPALWKSVGLIPLVLCASTFANVLEERGTKAFPPKGFIVGCATSAYQIEGAWNLDGKGPSIWDNFTHTPGKIADNTTGDVTCDHYHRYKEDVQLFKKLGVNTYSFTVAWSRVLPTGKLPVNQKGIQFYVNLVKELHKNGIKPIATLYHWDIPQALDDKYKAWLGDEVVTDFATYADVVFSHLAPYVSTFVTMNEPAVFCNGGYRYGDNAPGRCSDRSICAEGNSTTEPWICGHNALRAHAAAVNVYRTKYQKKFPGQISVILDNTWTEPLNPRSKADQAAAERSMQFYMGWFAHAIWIGDYPPAMRQTMGSILPALTPAEKRAIKGSADFFPWDAYTSAWATPVADYSSCVTNPAHDAWPECVTTLQQKGNNAAYGELIGAPTASNWNFDVPRGLKLGLRWIHQRYNPPAIYITENGMAEIHESQLPLAQALDDVNRVEWYKGYLESLRQAWYEGINIKGYIFWSCMDNFEWADGGLDFRFGVTHVDFHTQKRTLKSSAYFLRNYFSTKH